MNDFLPRGGCSGWTTGMIVAIDIADALITLAYFVLPALMYIFWTLIKTKPLSLPRSLILWYAAFIVLCGSSHLADIAMTWWPNWYADVFVHCLTASVSIGALYEVLVSIKRLQSKVSKVQRKRILSTRRNKTLFTMQSCME